MGKFKTHYDNLKVSRDAPPSVIKAAWRILVQEYHPDRNSSPDAADVMKIINRAYDILSDPDRRAAHDAWIAKEEAEGHEEASPRPSSPPPPPPQQPPPRQRTGRPVVLPQGGSGYVAYMPDDLRQLVEGRSKGNYGDQVRIDQGTSAFGAFGYALFGGFFGWLAAVVAMSEEVSSGTATAAWIACGLVGMFVGHQFSRIAGGLFGPLRPSLIATPLYVVETTDNYATYWPANQVTLSNAIRHLSNGAFARMTIDLTAGEITRTLTFHSQHAYNRFVEIFAEANQRYEDARYYGDRSEIDRVDELAGRTMAHAPRRAPKSLIAQLFWMGIGALVTVVISAGIAASMQGSNQGSTQAASGYTTQPPASATAPPTPIVDPFASGQPSPTASPATAESGVAINDPFADLIPTQPAAPGAADVQAPIDYIEAEIGAGRMPALSGYIEGEPMLATGGLSTLKIDNASAGSSDALVKLVTLQGASSWPVRTVLVRAGSSFTMRDLAPGQYDIRYLGRYSPYANKSESFSLNETETYEGTSYDNMTLTLYTVPNGNMSMERIPASEF